MRAGVNVKIDVLENRMSRCANRDAPRLDSNAALGSTRVSVARVTRPRRSKVRRTEWLERSENRAAIGWILACDQCQLVSQRWQIEHPIKLQQKAAAAGRAKTSQHHPRDQSEPDNHLDALDRDR